MSRLILVGCCPGRSGADTLVRVLRCHPEVLDQPPLPPALLSAAVDVLQYGAADSDSYLPRRAAQAFVAFHSRLAAHGPNGRHAANRLRESCGADDIYIPVYGHLLLPESRPADWWKVSIRTALIHAATANASTVTLGKVGAGTSAAVASLLSHDDLLVFVVRYPAVLHCTLTESTTDGMSHHEAIYYLNYTFRHVRFLLKGVRAHTVVVRLEELCTTPLDILPAVAKAAGLASERADIEHWAEQVSHVLPEDVCTPGTGTGQFDRRLQQLAKEWGY